jgi:hypothetical protein
MLHNTGRILILESLKQLNTAFPTTYSSADLLILDQPNPSPLLGISSNSTELACEMFRCLEYCNQHSRKHLGTFCLLFAVKVVADCLDADKNPREVRWLRSNIPPSISNVNGFEIGCQVLQNLPPLPLVS